MNKSNESNDKYGLQAKYGPLLTLKQLAEVLHRSQESLRVSLHRNSEYSNTLREARKRIGRRVYFKSSDITKLIDSL